MTDSLVAVIIDDEVKAINVLNSMLDQFCDQIDEIHVSSNPQEGIELIEKVQPDILFLDVNMPGLTGFDLLDKLNSFEGKIVFTTAHEEHAIKAFKYHAFDYLLKPILIKDLIDCVDRASKESETKQSENGNIESLLKTLVDQNGVGFQEAIAIHDKGGMVFIKPEQILFLEGQGNYAKIQCEDQHYLSTKTIKNFEDILNPSIFIRVHKSYIVNINEVSRFRSEDGGELILGKHHKIPVSRRKRHLLERFAV